MPRLFSKHHASFFSLWLCLLSLQHDKNACLASTTTEEEREKKDRNKISILVGFADSEEQRSFVESTKRTRNDLTIEYEYQMTNTVRMRVSKSERDALLRDRRITLVEDDFIVERAVPEPQTRLRRLEDGQQQELLLNNFTSQREETSYGLNQVQGTEPLPNLRGEEASHQQTPDGNKTKCVKTVCIIDSGLLIDHYDIPYSRGDGYIEGAEFGLPFGQYWYNPDPELDHGTAVAGIMVAKGGNGLGAVGVLPDGPEESKVCLRIARIFPDDSYKTTTGRVSEAAEWCAQQNADIINLSLAAKAFTFADRVTYMKLDEQGILVVGAAGNYVRKEYRYPSGFETVMSIGSINSGLRLSTFSNTNDQIELVAPGDEILTTSGTGMRSVSGTSFSTPYVSAIAAKVWVANPDCTSHQIRKALQESALHLGNRVPNDEFGYGVVQALDAHKYIFENMEAPCGGQFPSAVPTLPPSYEPTRSMSPTNHPTMSMAPTTCQEHLQNCTYDDHCCGELTCDRILVVEQEGGTNLSASAAAAAAEVSRRACVMKSSNDSSSSKGGGGLFFGASMLVSSSLFLMATTVILLL
eukprot:scaffold3865_cov107-Cylindrotheca_fusiformis.AAC.3